MPHAAYSTPTITLVLDITIIPITSTPFGDRDLQPEQYPNGRRPRRGAFEARTRSMPRSDPRDRGKPTNWRTLRFHPFRPKAAKGLSRRFNPGSGSW